MTNEELILKDLTARLPYNVKIPIIDWDEDIQEEVQVDATLYSINTDGYVRTLESDYEFDITSIKPYLFPLSSMTEEQQEEFDRIYADDMQVVANNLKNRLNGQPYKMNYGHYRHIDWLNAHHFDYRGLIEKGLALDATGKNIY